MDQAEKDWYTEANKRGMLSGAEKEWYSEGVSRGIFKDSTAIKPSKEPEAEVDYQQQNIDEMSVLDKWLVSIGRGMVDLPQGAKQIGLQVGEWAGLADEGSADAYTKEKSTELDYFKKLEEDSPWIAGTGRLVGGVASTPVPIGAVGGAVARSAAARAVARGAAEAPRIANAAAGTLATRALETGAISSAIGAGQFVEEGGSRGANAAIGGVLGVGSQVGLEKIGASFNKAMLKMRANGQLTGEASRAQADTIRAQIRSQAEADGIPAEEITDQYIARWAQQAQDAIGTADGGLTAAEREFGITLTRGQRAINDDAQIGVEDALRYGRRGQPGKDMMMAQQRRTEASTIDAAEKIKAGFAADGTPASNRLDVGAAIAGGVTREQKAAKAVVKKGYNDADSPNTGLLPADMGGLTRRTISVLDEGDDVLMPQTAGMIKHMKDLGKEMDEAGESGVSPLFNLNRIEMHRKRFSRALRTANESGVTNDARQVGKMQQAFDESIDDAIVRGLYQGDTEAIGMVKKARKLNYEYMKKFYSKDKDSRFIKKIIEENPTDEDVVRSLFTASDFSKGGASNLAKKYKEILGPNSDEWRMVKQTALDTIIKRTTSTAGDRSVQAISGTQTLKALSGAIKKNKGLIDEIFTPEELAQIRRFSVLVQKSQPPLRNPSGTASTLAEDGLGLIGGTSATDAALLASGNGAALALKKSGEFIIEAFRGRGVRRDVAKAYKPFDSVINAPDYVPAKSLFPINLGAGSDDISDDLR